MTHQVVVKHLGGGATWHLPRDPGKQQTSAASSNFDRLTNRPHGSTGVRFPAGQPVAHDARRDSYYRAIDRDLRNAQTSPATQRDSLDALYSRPDRRPRADATNAPANGGALQNASTDAPRLTPERLQAHDAAFHARFGPRVELDRRTFTINRGYQADSVSSGRSSLHTASEHSRAGSGPEQVNVNDGGDSVYGSIGSHPDTDGVSRGGIHRRIASGIASAFHRAFERIGNILRGHAHSSAPPDPLAVRTDPLAVRTEHHFSPTAHFFSSTATLASKADPNGAAGALERGSKIVIHEFACDCLKSSIPAVERMLKQPVESFHLEQFRGPLRELDLAVAEFAAITKKGARDGIVTDTLADRMQQLDKEKTHLWFRYNERRDMIDSPSRDRMLAFIAKVKHAVLDYASEIRNGSLAEQLVNAWHPIVDGRLSAAPDNTDHLLASVVRLEEMLQTSKTFRDSDFEQFKNEFRKLAVGASTFAALAKQYFRQGIISSELVGWAELNDETAARVLGEIEQKDRSPTNPQLRQQLLTLITDIKDVVLDHAFFVTRNDSAGVPQGFAGGRDSIVSDEFSVDLPQELDSLDVHDGPIANNQSETALKQRLSEV